MWGSGIAIRFGGAMDGIEVMAVIFAKKLGVTVGTFVMAYNVVFYVVCGYSNKPKTMVYFIVNRFQVARLREIVHETDPHAYITITEVADVFKKEKID